MANVRSVTNILGEFYADNYDNVEYEDLFASHDIGFPLAYYLWRGIAAPTEKSAEWLNQTWIDFCAFYEIDPHNDFDSLQSFLDFNESVS
jgi:hypothetical protein